MRIPKGRADLIILLKELLLIPAVLLVLCVAVGIIAGLGKWAWDTFGFWVIPLSAGFLLWKGLKKQYAYRLQVRALALLKRRQFRDRRVE
jgi:hypothetical protein